LLQYNEIVVIPLIIYWYLWLFVLHIKRLDFCHFVSLYSECV